jgi:3-hydroxypropionyl-coenzyme A dehydratase
MISYHNMASTGLDGGGDLDRHLRYITIQKEEDIMFIIIRRPEVLNALNIETIKELDSAFSIAAADDDINIVIITGSGERSFCAGADVTYVVNISPIEAQNYASRVHSLLNRIEQLDKPVIAAVNGFALGGGCELALASDFMIASSNAKLGQTEVRIGIPPGWGGTQRLVKLVGPAKAKELIFTGKMISAQEAYEIGLVNKVVSVGNEDQLPPEVDDKSDPKKEKERAAEIAKILNKKLINECIALAKEITKNGFTAIKVSKTLINKALDTDLDTGLRLEIYGWALCFAHEDRQKMMSAFLNKTKK